MHRETANFDPAELARFNAEREELLRGEFIRRVGRNRLPLPYTNLGGDVRPPDHVMDKS